jgi:hypothetical protein
MTTIGTKKCACGRPISGNKAGCRACLDAPVNTGNGVLEILNVQGGDVKITFDKANPAETIRTKRIIEDMLRRGYALVVEVEREGKTAYERVQAFDSEKGEYIIADFDSFAAAKADAASAEGAVEVLGASAESTGELCACGRPLRHRGACRGPRATRHLAMENTKATGIGRSAGG